MTVFLALVIGYLFGAKTGGRDLDQLGKSLKSLYETDEFADVVTAARVQFGHALRDLGTVIGGQTSPPEEDSDLVTRVTHLVSGG
jgi:hypothetical protein